MEEYALVILLRVNGLFDHRLTRYIRVPECDIEMVNSKALEYYNLINTFTDDTDKRDILLSILESINMEQKVINSITEILRIRSLKCPEKVTLGVTYDCILTLIREVEYGNGNIVYEPIVKTTITILGNGVVYIGDTNVSATIGYIIECEPEIVTPLHNFIEDVKDVLTSFAISISSIQATHYATLFSSVATPHS